MAPKKESAAAAKRGKPSAPDYLGIENYAVCKAALAAAVVPNQTVKANDSQVGLQERTCERYPMQLDAAVEKFGWPKQSVGRGSTTKDWTVELSKELRPAANNLWTRYNKVIALPARNQLSPFLKRFYNSDGKMPSGKSTADALAFVLSLWWKHLKKVEEGEDLTGEDPAGVEEEEDAPAASAAAAGGEPEAQQEAQPEAPAAPAQSEAPAAPAQPGDDGPADFEVGGQRAFDQAFPEETAPDPSSSGTNPGLAAALRAKRAKRGAPKAPISAEPPAGWACCGRCL